MYFSSYPSAEKMPLSAYLKQSNSANYILATRMGGIPELVAEPFDGLLMPPADPSRLVEAIETQIQKRDRLRDLRETRARASRGYGIREMSRHYSQVFASVNKAAADVYHSTLA